jgi:hypothetical protein
MRRRIPEREGVRWPQYVRTAIFGNPDGNLVRASGAHIYIMRILLMIADRVQQLTRKNTGTSVSGRTVTV